MRQLKITTTILLFVITIASCKKDSTPATTPLGSLNIVHAVVNLGTIQPNFSDPGTKGTSNYTYYNQIPTKIGFGFNATYTIFANKSVPLNIVAKADTTTVVYSTSLNFTNGSYYSLFLAGQAGAIDEVLVQDSYSNYTDSSCGVRFVNLSPDSKPVNVVMPATPGTNEFASVAYKQATAFNKYSALTPNTSYSFEVHDATSDSLLASYTLATPYFHNVTLVLTGLENGNPGLVVNRVNNF